ncbi:hypothetical protein [Dinghuibacter silviterrae]|uniref:Uncharacterized protein n=1 Tax=Dinghuibacter silviterrae TaxID=1539049 RepID=A0A4R8DWW5_9BACT|nr:hypothetical protein [Dinghuibacter silviterrae]TDX02418.1 hypothetical protein EDB95_3476 [Dinghuibacter silviterrae]
MMKRICFALLALTAFRGYSQPLDPAATALLEKVHHAYTRPDYLSFRVDYTYANDDQPGQPLERLSGEAEMDKGRSRFLIEGVETVSTEQYSVEVLPDAKLIYLSKAPRPGLLDPVNALDSALAHVKGLQASVTDKSVLVLRFPPGMMYSQIRLVIDPGTGLIKEALYDISTTGLLEKDQLDAPGHQAPYKDKGQVHVLFSGYAHGRFTDALFDPSRFFTRSGNTVQPSGSYKDYRIFLASRNI